MKKNFAEPYCEVVRFGRNDIVTDSQCSGDCWCNVAGYDYGFGEDECVGRNLPQCTCATVTQVNCV